MIRDRLVAILLVAVTLAGCGDEPAPGGNGASPTMTTASLDRPGRNGCLGVAGAIRDGDLGADGNQLIAGAASASTNTDIAAAGKLLQRASIAAAARKPGEDQDKLNSDIATAQQALLTACKTLLGDEPW